MAEALGIAAAVGGFVSLAKDIVDMGIELRRYYKDVQEADKTLGEIIMAVEANLQPVRGLLDLKHKQLAADFTTTSALGTSLYSCQARLTILKGKLSVVHRDLEKIGRTTAVFKRTFRRLKWPFQAESFKQELEDIRQYSLIFQFALSVDGFTLLSRTVLDVTEILRNQRQISNNFDSLYQTFSSMNALSVDIRGIKSWNQEQVRKEKIAQRSRALDWLSEHKMLQKHSDILSKRHGSTGNWIVEQDSVQKWLQGGATPKIIWCNGGPGIGKTMASAIVMEELRSDKLKTSGGLNALAFAICDSQDPETQSALAILAAIAKQLFQYLPESDYAWDTIVKMSDDASKAQRKPSISQINDLLLTLAKSFSSVHVVVDGVDEMGDKDERRNMLERLLEFIGCGSGVILFATSRPNFDDIARAFRGAETVSLTAQKDDIRRYVQHYLNRDSSFSDRLTSHEDLKQRIERQIVDQCAGYFLIAVLQTRWITRQRTIRQIEDALEDIPRDLSHYYDRTLDRIKRQTHQDEELALQIFRWVLHASNDLTSDQLCHALSVEWDAPGDQSRSFDAEKVYLPTDIVDVCLGLVTIEEGSKSVRFAHNTIKAYFETKATDLSDDSALVSIHGRLAATCLTYLGFDDFAEGPCASEVDLRTTAKHYTFLLYAARHVGDHLRNTNDTDRDILLEQYRRLEENEMKRLFLLQVESYFLGKEPFFESDSFILAKYPWIMVLARWGYTPIVEASVKHGESLEARSLTRQTPLHKSAALGHLHLVKFLCDGNADCTITDWRGQSPMMLAAMNGHTETFQSLVERGSRLSSRDCTYNTSLIISVYSNQEKVLSYIMRKDPRPDLKDWLKAMEYALAEGTSLRIPSILLNDLEPSSQAYYLQKSLVSTNQISGFLDRPTTRKIFHLARMADCSMDIHEALQDALIRREHSQAMFLLELSKFQYLPNPLTTFCHMLSTIKDWGKLGERDRLNTVQYSQLKFSRKSESPLSDPIYSESLSKTFESEWQDSKLFEIIDLFLIQLQDGSLRTFLESLLLKPSKAAALSDLVQSGVKPDSKLLCHVCEVGDVEAIRGMAGCSVPLDEKFDGKTPLEYSAKSNQFTALSLLLELGARDVQGALKATTGDTCALHLLQVDLKSQLLSYHRHGNALRALNTSRVEENAKLLRGNCKITQHYLDTCLIQSSHAANAGAVRFLLEAGANPRCTEHSLYRSPFLNVFVIEQKLRRQFQAQYFNEKIHNRDERRDKEIDAIIEYLSDPRWRQ